jgi:hypothetical protein
LAVISHQELCRMSTWRTSLACRVALAAPSLALMQIEQR